MICTENSNEYTGQCVCKVAILCCAKFTHDDKKMQFRLILLLERIEKCEYRDKVPFLAPVA